MGFKSLLLASALCTFVYLANAQPGLTYFNTQNSKIEEQIKLLSRDMSRLLNSGLNRDYAYGFPYSSAPGGFYGDGLDMYTGTNTIQVPIWSIGVSGASASVSLGYCATGIKVAQSASNVGLGWSLNAGGCIRRVVRCYPDDITPNTNTTTYIGWLYSNGFQASNVQTFNINSATPGDVGLLMGYPEASVASGTNYDLEPDIFMIDCPYIGGSFIFKGTYTNGVPDIETIGATNLKVEAYFESTQHLDYFVLTDNNGIKYTFSAPSTTNPDEQCKEYYYTQYGTYDGSCSFFRANFARGLSYNMDNVTAWFLKKMETPEGEEINFSYEQEKYVVDAGSAEMVRYPTSNGKKYTNQNYNPWQVNTSNAISTWRIKKIETNEAVVDFLANTEREDVYQAQTSPAAPCKRIDQINVYSIIGQTHHLLRSFDLGYDYFTDNSNLSGNKYVANFTGSEKRLRLLWVQESCKNKIFPKTAFHYRWDNQLPDRFSYASDLWGYYNGMTTNNTYSPKIYIYNDPSFVGQNKYRSLPIPGNDGHLQPYTYHANRICEEEAMKIGMLYRIDYPEGYTEEFEYEPHEFYWKGEGPYHGGGLRLSKKKVLDNENTISEVTYNYMGGVAAELPTYGYYDPTNDNYPSTNIDLIKQRWMQTDYDLSNMAGQVGYSQVEVITNAGADNNGKIVYYFKNPENLADPNLGFPFYEKFPTKLVQHWPFELNGPPYPQPSDYDMDLTKDCYPYPPDVNSGWFKGMLDKVEVKDKYSNLVSETIYSYQPPTYKGFVYGIKVGFINNTGANLNPVNALSKYKTYYGINYPISTVANKAYTNNGSNCLTTTTYYTFNTNLQLLSTKIANSDGSVIEKTQKYPLDYTTNLASTSSDAAFSIDQMKQKHILDVPIESVTYRSASMGGARFVTDAKVAEYKCLSINGKTNVPMPKYLYDFQCQSPVAESGTGQFVPSSLTTNNGFTSFNKDTRYARFSNFDKYDTEGKLLEAHKEYEPYTTTVYSTLTDYPIASVVNALSDEIFYTGFEFEDVQQGYFSSSQQFPAYAGNYCAQTTGGSANYSSLAWWKQFNTGAFNGSKGFKFSLRAKGSPTGFLYVETIGGTPIIKTILNNSGSTDWKLLSIEFTASELQANGATGFFFGIGGGNAYSPAFFDEIKAYPSNALMTTTSFDYMGNALAVGDANEQYLFNTYDDVGNAQLTRDTKKDIVQLSQTSFGQPAEFNVYDLVYNGVLRANEGICVGANNNNDGSSFALTITKNGQQVFSQQNTTGIFANCITSAGTYTLTLEYANDNIQDSQTKTIQIY